MRIPIKTGRYTEMKTIVIQKQKQQKVNILLLF